MAATTWEKRVKVLNSSGYARYDESTARYIADTTSLLVEKYDGDLRKLREEAEQSPQQERELLKQFKGIGDVGVNIFFVRSSFPGTNFTLSPTRGLSKRPSNSACLMTPTG